MKIGYLLPMTVIDYPGKVAALIYTAGCNFRCPFCHNAELVLPEQIKKLDLVPEDDVLDLLRKRKGFLDALSITGGEPTLQPDLYEFIKKVKEIGVLVKVDTNGSNPDVIERLLADKLVDYIAMDVKGPERRYNDLANSVVNMDAIKETIGAIMSLAPDYEFRTTVAPTITEEDLLDTIDLVKGAKRYFLQKFIVPDKDLVDPTWNKKKSLSRAELDGVWGKIRHSFDYGGVR